jgi:hypothetical protein
VLRKAALLDERLELGDALCEPRDSASTFLCDFFARCFFRFFAAIVIFLSALT